MSELARIKKAIKDQEEENKEIKKKKAAGLTIPAPPQYNCQGLPGYGKIIKYSLLSANNFRLGIARNRIYDFFLLE